MTWTRLFHIKNIDLAFKRVIPNLPRPELAVNKRYQAAMRKEFRLAGVPWIYNLAEEKPNPRDKKPKGKKHEKHHSLRLAKIQKALKENDAKILEFRQMRLNKRPLGGFDNMMSKELPSWIKFDASQIPSYMLKGREDDDDKDPEFDG